MKKDFKSLEPSHGAKRAAPESDSGGRMPDGSRPAHDLRAPVLLVTRIFETWNLEAREQSILLGLDASDQSLVQDILSGKPTICGRDFRDRVAYLILIRRTLFALFQDDYVENEWLRESHQLLGNRAPMDLLLEGSMANLLLVKEYCDEVGGM